MDLLGRGLLLLAFGLALYGVGASLAAAVGGRFGLRNTDALARSGRRAMYVLAGCTTIAFVLLEIAFVRTDLSFAVVADHSSTTTPLLYRLSAAWSSQEGSLLLWVWLLSLWSSLALSRARRDVADVLPWTQVVLLGMAGFFLLLLAFFTSPFDVLAQRPADGVGLEPVLQYPSMAIHPPMVYAGYTLFSVPFAFAIGSLAAGRVGADWIRYTRRYTLTAWLVLGAGVVLGSRWSYAELGWGGYWGWDAVENAALLPWLVGTAFLHSVMIHEKRGMLRTWSVSLILITGILSIVGTFVVRSGILSSIHSFTATDMGVPFLLLIVAMTVGSFALVVHRREMLRSEHRIDSLLSREALFLGGNVVLLGMAVVILWLTFFPLVSELLTGDQRPVKTATYGAFVAPLSMLLAVLTGLGPLAAWRRTTASRAWRQVRVPLLFGVAALVAVLVLESRSLVVVPVAVLCGGFVLGAVAQELVRGARARRVATSESWPVATARLVGRNRRRYGGYLAHAGFAVLIVAVAASSELKQQERHQGNVGMTFTSGPYTMKYEKAIGTWKLSSAQRIERITLGAQVGVFKDGRRVETMRPTRDYYPAPDDSEGPVSRYYLGSASTEVALDAGLRKDLWLAVQPDGDALANVLSALDRQVEPELRADPSVAPVAALRFAQLYALRPSSVTFQAIDSPLVSWIWIGAIVVFLGGLLAVWPAPDLATRKVRAGRTARVARELGRAPGD